MIRSSFVKNLAFPSFSFRFFSSFEKFSCRDERSALRDSIFTELSSDCCFKDADMLESCRERSWFKDFNRESSEVCWRIWE